MTDLMVGLLFIFIIIIMTFAVNYRHAETRSEDARRKLTEEQEQAREAEREARQQAEATRKLAEELRISNDRLTDNQKTLTYILEQIERSLRDQGIQVRIFPESGILRLPESILFDSGRAELNDSGRRAVAVLGKALSRILSCFSKITPASTTAVERPSDCPSDRYGRLEAVYIEGHTDDQPISPGRADGIRTNWDLSVARAIHTYQELRSAFQEADALANDRGDRLIGVSGYGEFRPVAPNDTEEGRRANRRIDLRFLMAVPQSAPAP